jgi:tryptophanyl-tRNA synthetase
MPRVLSCIQPTGEVHLGNYLGALRNWVAGQHECDAFHGIVDLHALTVPQEPDVLREKTLELAMVLFAIGLDPDVATIFVQSHVPEHTRLCWLMECNVALGELERMTQFKDKAAKQGELISAGLLMYPALQAADILIYDADEVPVGDDQRQHIELAREIARRFNATYAEVFPEPEHVIPKVGARIMDLQEPEAKMSTSYGTDSGLVYIDDEPEAIVKKIKRAQTDSGSEIRRAPDKVGITNLIDIYSVARDVPPEQVESEFEGQGYGAFKQSVGEAVAELLAPVRERYAELRADEDALERTLRAGAERAREIAVPTMAEVHSAMGLGPRT